MTRNLAAIHQREHTVEEQAMGAADLAGEAGRRAQQRRVDAAFEKWLWILAVRIVVEPQPHTQQALQELLQMLMTTMASAAGQGGVANGAAIFFLRRFLQSDSLSGTAGEVAAAQIQKVITSLQMTAKSQLAERDQMIAGWTIDPTNEALMVKFATSLHAIAGSAVRTETPNWVREREELQQLESGEGALWRHRWLPE